MESVVQSLKLSTTESCQEDSFELNVLSLNKAGKHFVVVDYTFLEYSFLVRKLHARFKSNLRYVTQECRYDRIDACEVVLAVGMLYLL